MRYLKIFEAKVKKDWNKMVIDIEDEFRKLIKSNTDITLDYIKDISASALDLFRDESIGYDEFLEIGEENDDDSDAYGFMSKDGKIDEDEFGRACKDDYESAIDFYKKLFTSKKNAYLNITINIYYNQNNHPKMSDPMVKSLIDESKDIESRCKGHEIEFEFRPNIGKAYAPTGGYPTGFDTDGEDLLYSFSFEFRIKLDPSKMQYDYRKVISPDAIADFDRFISMYKIPKEGEGDLVKLINASNKKKKKN